MQYSNLIWRDSQPYSEMFDDIYYSSDQNENISGEDEFKHVFFNHNGLPERWQGADQFVIAELGLGSGLNCLLTIRKWLKHCEACAEDKILHYIAIERYPLSPQAITELLSRYPELRSLCDEFIEHYPPAVETSHTRHLFNNRVVIHFKFQDALEALTGENLKVDAWYLDGFAPSKNAAMWSTDLFEKLAINSREAATFSTYTAAGFVKRNLISAGFDVKKINGYGKKRDMLKGVFSGSNIKELKYSDKPWFSSATNSGVLKSKAESKQLCVIGAGVAGLCVAYAMIKRGWKVTIIDRHLDVASETSGNPAAIVCPRLSIDGEVDMAFYTAAYCYSVAMLNRLQKKHSKQFWFNDGIVQQINEKRLNDIINKNQFNKNYVDIQEKIMGTMLPELKDGESVFANFSSAGVVLPSVLCAVIKEECGENLSILHAEIDGITNTNNKWQCFSDTKQLIESNVLVVANGEGVNKIGMETVFPVKRVRGQVAVLNANEKSKKISMAINSNIHITPSIEGKHYVGASYSHTHDSLAIDEDETAELLKSLDKMLPDTFESDDCVDAWAGFRIVSTDRVPIVGVMPDKPFFENEYSDISHGRVNKFYQPAKNKYGLYVSAAHGSRGFTTAFLSAEIIAAQINDEPMPINKKILEYLSPARFIVNDLKRG
ncbi:tRNA (5-methylaminomethyl-2-thiouridylate)-methyltransferase / FAD-dependent cmnm(5)s(2)U34 oxidoreductase [hydrothermal vent metagenome]|uniref:tRNA (5-methylaminomethyl-2-thiouridylate)-methyltransferase / FAD-dependent cmnm(5)s(2)U34 oxidoreductase n=1 Tax=hydrothermal vent metagenome TaxID=652676 RepID=A0A3B0WVC3_9ZZZZ